MRKKLCLALWLVLMVSPLWAAEEPYAWEDDFCTYSGYYDNQRVMKSQIDAARELLFNDPGISSIYALPISADPVEMINYDIQPFKDQCHGVIARLQHLSLPQLVELDLLRQENMSNYQRYCQLGEIAWSAYREPEILRSVSTSPRCHYYVDALTGKVDLLEAWTKAMYIELCQEYGDDDAAYRYCRLPFENKMASAQKMEYARAEVLAFAWWNACVDLSPPVMSDVYRKAENAFFGLMKKVKQSCDYPSRPEDEFFTGEMPETGR